MVVKKTGRMLLPGLRLPSVPCEERTLEAAGMKVQVGRFSYTSSVSVVLLPPQLLSAASFQITTKAHIAWFSFSWSLGWLLEICWVEGAESE